MDSEILVIFDVPDNPESLYAIFRKCLNVCARPRDPITGKRKQIASSNFAGMYKIYSEVAHVQFQIQWVYVKLIKKINKQKY